MRIQEHIAGFLLRFALVIASLGSALERNKLGFVLLEWSLFFLGIR